MGIAPRADSFVHSQLIEAALKHDERGFLLLHGNDLVLVVVVPLGETALERNKDIVLRHGSVSKFHAWFETNASDGLCVADAESRNATRLNDQMLIAREKAPVHAGDRLRFGTVETILCRPATLWSLVRSGSRLAAAGR